MARILNGLGSTAEKWGDVGKAEQFFHQSLAILQSSAPTGWDAALAWNGLGNIARHRGYLARAEALHRKAFAIQKRLAHDSLALADSLDELGNVAYLRSDYARAEDFYRESLVMRQKFTDGRLDSARSLDGLGSVAYDRDDLAKAEEYYHQALSIAAQLGPESLIRSKLLIHLSFISLDRGDLARGWEEQRQALLIAQKIAPDGLDVASTLKSLADVSYRRGDLTTAEEYSNQALTIRQRLVPGSPVTASSLSQQGMIAHAKGDLRKAEDYYLQGLVIRKRLNPGSLAVAAILNGLGVLVQEREDLTKAERFYQQSLRIKERLLPGSLELANGLMNLGLLAQGLGHLAQAELYCRKALFLKRKLVPESLELASTLNVLGEIVLNRGKISEAEAYGRQALTIQQKLNPDSLEITNTFYFLGLLAQAHADFNSAENFERQALRIQEKFAPGTAAHAAILAALADVLKDEQRWDLAAQLYQQSLDSLETQLIRLGGGTGPRSEFRARYADIYQNYISVLMHQGKPEAAFQISEQLRARSLLEMLKEGKIDLHQGVDANLLQREHDLTKLLTAKSNARLHLLTGKAAEESIAQANREVEELLGQYHALQEEMREKSPDYAALINPRPVTVQEVQQLLDGDSLLLEYSLGEKQSYLWAISRNGFWAYPLPERTKIEHQVQQVYRLLTIPGQPVLTSFDLERARRGYWKEAAGLSRMILAPVAGQLKNQKILVAADGALQYVPFAALPAPDANPQPYRSPLIVDHEISYLPSASVLSVLNDEARGRKQPAKSVAIFADPVFRKEDARVVHQLDSSDRNPTTGAGTYLPVDHGPVIHDSDVLKPEGLHFSRLPFSRREAKSILAVIPGEKTLTALDFDASLALATSPLLAQYRTVHFATHGVLNSRNPDLSGLVFSLVDKQGRPQNGFLDLEEIYNLNLPVNLVVLSACETALGKDIRGEGIISLTRGFMYAGALHVMASLWKIDDASTAELMQWFYKAMEEEKLPPAAALRRAQVYMWKKNPQDLPFIWAAFEVQGDSN